MSDFPADPARYYRLWSDEQGDSHCEEVSVGWHEAANYASGVPPVGVSEALRAGEAHFSVLPAGWFGDWHPAPSRQFVVLLRGRLEVTTGDGAITSGPGTVWLIEDLTGRGHCTRVPGDEDAVRISVTLP